MKNFIIFLTINNLICACLTVQIKCKHQQNSWTYRGPIQECLVDDLEVSDSNETVTSLIKHDYISIKSFFIHDSPKCFYLPKGIEKHFDDLEVLIVAGTGLKSITNQDLRPFKVLKELYMNHNALEELQSDLFIYNTQIMAVNFGNNRLKTVGCGILEPLYDLQVINFMGNPVINKNLGGLDLIEKFKSEFKCQVSTTSSPSVSALTQTMICDSDQRESDLELKIAELELQLNQTVTKLEFILKHFCNRFNDWENELCKGVVVATTTIHPDDQTEGYIIGVDE